MILITNIERRLPLTRLIIFLTNEYQLNNQLQKWPTFGHFENVWGILRERLRGNEFETVEKLKEAIIKEWKNFTPELCDKLMSSIGLRLKAVFKGNGNQVVKNDY